MTINKRKRWVGIVSAVGALVVAALVLFFVFRNGNSEPPKINRPVATITMQNGTVIRMDLYHDVSPNTVANFVDLANNGFYDGLSVFNVSHEMVKLGSPTNTMTGNAGFTIKGEFELNGVKNTQPFKKGTVLLWHNDGAFNSGSSIFAILLPERAAYLETRYAPLGQVWEEDLEKVVALEDVDREADGQATTLQYIASIRVDLKGITLPAAERNPIVK